MWVENKCIGIKCLIVINVDFEYDVVNNKFLLIIICKSFYKVVIVELFGYLCGYDSVV